MLSRLTLVMATLALILGVAALIIAVGKPSEVEVANGKYCVDCDEVMRSIADSFRMNRLDYELHWSTPGKVHALYGVSETASLPSSER